MIEVFDMDVDPAFSPSIRKLLVSQIHNPVPANQDVFEATSEAMLLTQQLRYGPKPSPESQTAIRSVIRDSIESHQPIPVLVVWGSRKPGIGRQPDIADISALRNLQCIVDSVTKVYSAGLDLRIRIEDSTGLFLFEQEGPQVADYSLQHSTDLKTLMPMIIPSAQPVLESELLEQAGSTLPALHGYANTVRNHLREFLAGTRETPDHMIVGSTYYADLKNKVPKWQGMIPHAQRLYFYDTYRKLEPHFEFSLDELEYRLATYFAQAVARYHLEITGAKSGWGSYIKYSLVPPVPGSPSQLFDRTIYLRTIRESISRTHMPPWRGYGVVSIDDNGDATPRILRPSDYQLAQSIVPGLTMLRDGSQEVKVRTDYLMTA